MKATTGIDSITDRMTATIERQLLDYNDPCALLIAAEADEETAGRLFEQLTHKDLSLFAI